MNNKSGVSEMMPQSARNTKENVMKRYTVYYRTERNNLEREIIVDARNKDDAYVVAQDVFGWTVYSCDVVNYITSKGKVVWLKR